MPAAPASIASMRVSYRKCSGGTAVRSENSLEGGRPRIAPNSISQGLRSSRHFVQLQFPRGMYIMVNRRSILRFCGLCAITVAAGMGGLKLSAQEQPDLSHNVSEVQREFVVPPDDARVITRWWWFGSAVTKPELQREILAMKAGGFGGFEIQPVYPLALDDPLTGFKNLPYLSPDFLDMVKFAADTGEKNDLRVDLTLSSGWPYGGPSTPITEAAECLRDSEHWDRRTIAGCLPRRRVGERSEHREPSAGGRAAEWGTAVAANFLVAAVCDVLYREPYGAAGETCGCGR
jgi:hypothetical protein